MKNVTGAHEDFLEPVSVDLNSTGILKLLGYYIRSISIVNRQSYRIFCIPLVESKAST